MKTITIDIETNGLFPSTSRITCIGAKTSDEDFYCVADPDEVKILVDFYNWLGSKATDYVIVTHNGKSFDIPFILKRASVYGLRTDVEAAFKLFEHFDTIEIIKKRMKLNELATLFSVQQKSGSGLQAIQFFNEGKFQEIQDYCFDDVKITEEVFQKYQMLKTKKPNRTMKVLPGGYLEC